MKETQDHPASNEELQESAAPVKRIRWKRWVFGLPLFLFALLAALILDRSPNVEKAQSPSAQQVRSAKALFSHVRRYAGSTSPQPVAVSWAEVASATNVANQLLGERRLHISHGQQAIELEASLPLPLGFWMNLQGHVPNSPEHFPPISGKIGRLPVPAWAAGPMIRFGRWLGRLRGFDIPQPEAIFGGVAIADNGVILKLAAPKNAGGLSSIVGAKLPPLPPEELARHYCRVAESLKKQPAVDFVALVRRSFALAPDAELESNRIAMVTLPMFVVSRQLGALADAKTDATRACAIPMMDLTLGGRADLAKHWAMSAAMTAAIGADVSNAMGTWKEIADSGPAGSGFSFIDLTADRSGVTYAQSLTAKATANATREKLAQAQDADLLPAQAMYLEEGMLEADFARKFKSTDDPRYAEITKRIDALLIKRLGLP